MLDAAAVIHRAAIVEDGRGRPQRIIGRRQQHFIAGVQQRAQTEIDQFADAVADEHALGRCVGRAAPPVERGDRLARGRQALLMGVRIGIGDVIGDGALQMFRRAESESTRVADVQLDQLPALTFQLAGAPGEFAADLVADLGQAFAGFEGGFRAGGRHRRARTKSVAKPSRNRPPLSPGQARGQRGDRTGP